MGFEIGFGIRRKIKVKNNYVNVAAIFLSLFIIVQPSYGATYYVDGACEINGNGLADGCAGSSGGAGAFLDPQSCFSAVLAGETCYIKNGTGAYITNYDPGVSESWYRGGFHVDHSGTAGNPITIQNYPGENPWLAACDTSGTSWCGNPTITAPDKSYIIFDGLHVRGAFYLIGIHEGIVVRNNEVTMGWGGGDGNWDGIRIQPGETWHQNGGINGTIVKNNYLHDLTIANGVTQSGGSCIKLYYNTETIVEYNTCKNYAINGAGIDDKASGIRNILRYNYMENLPYGIRINNNHLPRTIGVKVYGNIFNASFDGEVGGVLLSSQIESVEIYNNTTYNSSSGLYMTDSGVQGAFHYNNIISNSTNVNMIWYNNAIPVLSDYNAFTPNKQYRSPSGWNSSLTDYQRASRLDSHSSETNCQFINPSIDFHLNNTSPCKTAGRTGGVSTGTVVELGAYGVTDCVGHTCGSISDTEAPTIPVNLSAAAISSSQINLTWTASQDNTGVSGYRVERCRGLNCGNFSQVGTSGSISYSDSALSASTTYSYQVKAYDVYSNVSGASGITSATTLIPAFYNLIVSNLVISSAKAYQIIDSGLIVSAVKYIDRAYTFASVPSIVLNKTYIKTSNDDKLSIGNNFISFTISQPATIYIAHDDMYAVKPSWLSQFNDTGENITGNGTFSLYSKHFPAGPVTLGGNTANGQGDNDMYTVIIASETINDTTAPSAPKRLRIKP